MEQISWSDFEKIEFRAGTVPTNLSSVLKMEGQSKAGDDVQLSWSSVTGKSYTVYESTNLLTTWIEPPIASNVPASSSNSTMYTVSNVTHDAAFFHVLVE